MAASFQKITNLVYHTQRAIVGLEPDTHGLGERYWSAVAHSLFSSIFAAFLAKSRHEEDDLGQSWKDHDPKTKAYNRPDARKNLKLYDNRAVRTPSLPVRPTLPPAVNKQWGGRWFGLWLQLTSRHGQGDSTAGKIAGGSTWEHFKALGYPTLIGLTRNLNLPLLNKTGTLQRSIFPAPLSGGVYIPIDSNQIYRREDGKLTIGTRLSYAVAVDKARPLWPKDIGPWLDQANAAGRDALHQQLEIVLKQL